MRRRKRAALFSPPPPGLDIDNAGGSAFCARITRKDWHTTADHNTGRWARLVENSRVRRYGRCINGVGLRREARERYSCHQKKKIFLNSVHLNGRPALHSFHKRNGRMGSLRGHLTARLHQRGQVGELILRPRNRSIQSSFLKKESAARDRRVISFKSSGRYGSFLAVLAICWATAFKRSKRAS